MLRGIVAIGLLVLSALPFTAPFSTCPLSTTASSTALGSHTIVHRTLGQAEDEALAAERVEFVTRISVDTGLTIGFVLPGLTTAPGSLCSTAREATAAGTPTSSLILRV